MLSALRTVTPEDNGGHETVLVLDTMAKAKSPSGSTIYLQRLSRNPQYQTKREAPWSMPVFEQLEQIEFTSPVTFLVGENGCGKSTLLEAIAVGVETVPAGAHSLSDDDTMVTARALAAGFRFGRKAFPKRKLLFRAEDILGFTRRVVQDMDSLRGIEADLAGTLQDSYGKRLAINTMVNQRLSLEISYGRNPHAKSHGETFLALLRQRLKPGGLYLLDEPETPLSPQRVLELMALIAECVRAQCQFIIATHSPMLMAQPEATILAFADDKIQACAWSSLPHVTLLRDFLNNPQPFLTAKVNDAGG